jgi:hypothetical protein
VPSLETVTRPDSKLPPASTEPIDEFQRLYPSAIQGPVKIRRAFPQSLVPIGTISLSHWWLGLLYAVAFGVLGHYGAPKLQHLADALNGLPARVAVAPPGSGALRVIVGLPLTIAAAVLWILVHGLAIGVTLGDRYKLLPAIGFIVGCMPSAHLALFKGVFRVVRFVVHVTVVSTYQLPQTKGFANKLWALAPLVFSAGMLWLLFILGQHVVAALNH